MLPNLQIFGIQGSGKDTQAVLLAQRFNLLYLSSGELIRKRIEHADETADRLRLLLNQGKLIPNTDIHTLVEEALSTKPERGIVASGIIRTKNQLDAFAAYWPTHQLDQPFAIELKVSDEMALNRCTKRGRTDDSPEALLERFQTYHHQTEPLLEGFRQAGRLLTVNGEGERETITEQIYQGLATSYPLLHVAH